MLDEEEESGPDLDKLDPETRQLILAGIDAPRVTSKVRHLVDDQEDEERENELMNKIMGDITEFE